MVGFYCTQSLTPLFSLSVSHVTFLLADANQAPLARRNRGGGDFFFISGRIYFSLDSENKRTCETCLGHGGSGRDSSKRALRWGQDVVILCKKQKKAEIHNCELHIPDLTLQKPLIMWSFFFSLLSEVRKRRKSLRRRFDSFSKEKKERGGFVVWFSRVVTSSETLKAVSSRKHQKRCRQIGGRTRPRRHENNKNWFWAAKPSLET